MIIKKIMCLCLVSTAGACSTFSDITVREDVKPWERGILAQDRMQIPADAMHSFSDEHIYFSKEAASGGNGVGGGGCGCN